MPSSPSNVGEGSFYAVPLSRPSVRPFVRLFVRMFVRSDILTMIPHKRLE